jgi:hypothetical protein
MNVPPGKLLQSRRPIHDPIRRRIEGVYRGLLEPVVLMQLPRRPHAAEISHDQQTENQINPEQSVSTRLQVLFLGIHVPILPLKILPSTTLSFAFSASSRG